jgi:hypothetical protein
VLNVLQHRIDRLDPKNTRAIAAYTNLRDTLADPENAEKSVNDIIGIARKTGGERAAFHEYFVKKLDRFHFFKNSGDFYDKICNLPRPRVFLTPKAQDVPALSKGSSRG